MIERHVYSPHSHTSQYDPSNPYIPIPMFLNLPASQDEYYVGQGKQIRRFIFQGNGNETYTTFEKQKYRQLLQYLDENKEKIPKIIVNNPFWTQCWKLRWLTSEKFDVKNAVKAMEMHSNYLETNRINVTSNSEKILKQGVFYVSGRDAYYRPILVFDIDKMIRSKMSEEELLESQKFFFEKVLNDYLLPGQVQTWVAIIDVGYQNLTSLISPLKSSIGFLSDTFRNRMRIAYVVRIPMTLSFLWRIVKNFLQEETARKINFLDEQQIGPLLQYTNPSQLQKKYGGTQQQITQFWPPRTVQKLQQLNLLDFSHPKVSNILVSEEAYKAKLEKGKLTGHKICNLIIEKQKQKERVEEEKNNQIQQKIRSQLKIQEQENRLKQIQNRIWPNQYTPLPAPTLNQQDSINWESLLK